MQKNKNSKLPILAIDIGGTKIAAALVAPDNRILARDQSPTPAAGGLKPVLNRIFATVDQLLSQSNTTPTQLSGIAIAAAGAIDTARGLVTTSPNLSGWTDVPLREMVKKRYGINTCLLNDASAAALAEHRLGAGRGTDNIIYITVSTGIGGGIIINGELYPGTSGCAGELGHMTIDASGPVCPCGNRGCLEMLASGKAIAGEAKRRLKNGEKSQISNIVSGDLEAVTAENIALAAKGGDRLATDVICQAAGYLGVGMVNLVNIFNPEMIVVGGGLSKMGELLLGPAREVVKQRAFPLCAGAVRIVTAKLGDNAGLLGAAIYARPR